MVNVSGGKDKILYRVFSRWFSVVGCRLALWQS
jgi:hypothetical protein